MGEVLSQNEIDNLLAALSAGELDLLKDLVADTFKILLTFFQGMLANHIGDHILDHSGSGCHLLRSAVSLVVLMLHILIN